MTRPRDSQLGGSETAFAGERRTHEPERCLPGAEELLRRARQSLRLRVRGRVDSEA